MGVYNTLSLELMINKHALHEATQVDDPNRVKALLKEAPNLVFSQDWNNDTPLHLAAYFGYRDVAELLLTHGADVNAINSYGRTPLHRAAFNGHQDIAKLLLKHGADINAKNNFVDTPLHEAVVNGSYAVAELLRQHGGHE